MSGAGGTGGAGSPPSGFFARLSTPVQVIAAAVGALGVVGTLALTGISIHLNNGRDTAVNDLQEANAKIGSQQAVIDEQKRNMDTQTWDLSQQDGRIDTIESQLKQANDKIASYEAAGRDKTSGGAPTASDPPTLAGAVRLDSRGVDLDYANGFENYYPALSGPRELYYDNAALKVFNGVFAVPVPSRPGYQTCKNADYSTSADVPRDNVVERSYYCVLTTDKRFSSVQIGSRDDEANTIGLQIVTWRP